MALPGYRGVECVSWYVPGDHSSVFFSELLYAAYVEQYATHFVLRYGMVVPGGLAASLSLIASMLSMTMSLGSAPRYPPPFLLKIKSNARNGVPVSDYAEKKFDFRGVYAKQSLVLTACGGTRKAMLLWRRAEWFYADPGTDNSYLSPRVPPYKKN